MEKIQCDLCNHESETIYVDKNGNVYLCEECYSALSSESGIYKNDNDFQLLEM